MTARQEREHIRFTREDGLRETWVLHWGMVRRPGVWAVVWVDDPAIPHAAHHGQDVRSLHTQGPTPGRPLTAWIQAQAWTVLP